MRSRAMLALLSGALCVCLTACATRTAAPTDAFLAPCIIEGAHASLDEVMEDPISTNLDLYNFAGQAEDAVKRCNADKEAIKKAVGK